MMMSCDTHNISDVLYNGILGPCFNSFWLFLSDYDDDDAEYTFDLMAQINFHFFDNLFSRRLQESLSGMT